jgi:hypothetical protein
VGSSRRSTTIEPRGELPCRALTAASPTWEKPCPGFGFIVTRVRMPDKSHGQSVQSGCRSLHLGAIHHEVGLLGRAPFGCSGSPPSMMCTLRGARPCPGFGSAARLSEYRTNHNVVQVFDEKSTNERSRDQRMCLT